MSSDDNADPGWPLKEVWKDYEQIAMHFNDLLIRLRTQALAGVAALSALVGIFGKTETEVTNWKMAALVLAFLLCFWVAIWVIDFLYYNRLLVGAVRALLDVEELSKSQSRVREIDISTKIEKSVAGQLPISTDVMRVEQLSRGRWFFYIIVFTALLGGFVFSFNEYRTLKNSKVTFLGTTEALIPSAVPADKPTSSALPAGLPSEHQLRDVLCSNMQREVPIPEARKGSVGRMPRADCINDDYAIEVDWTEKWHDALGKSLQYASLTGKRAGIILLCHKEEQLCLTHGLRLQDTISNRQIEVTVWQCPHTARSLDDCLKR